MSKHRWTDDTIVIDFIVPEQIQEFIDEIEEYDNNDDFGCYLSAVDYLDVVAKWWYASGDLTHHQYNLLRWKYR